MVAEAYRLLRAVLVTGVNEDELSLQRQDVEGPDLDSRPDQGLRSGAGDGNRTRTVSLGS